MNTFRIAQHSVEPQRAAVEVIGEHGELLAVLYADGDQYLRLVSKRLEGAVIDAAYPATININLKAAP